VPGKNYAVYLLKAEKRVSCFNQFRLDPLVPSNTLTATSGLYTHWSQCRKLTLREWKRLGSFPDDYQAKNARIGAYLIGMSVPPKLTEQVARAVCEQWLGKKYNQPASQATCKAIEQLR
jgi:site-specific DNA-cytosine methylase